jgi:hypothetical protein
MQREQIRAGATSQTIDVFVYNGSLTTGLGLTGLAYNSGSLVASYRKGATGTRTAISLATQTVGGAYSSGGFVEIDATNMPGWYRLDIPNAAIDTAGRTYVTLKGATNMVPVNVIIDCVLAAADVTHLLGTAWLTPATAGTPDVNTKTLSNNAITASAINADAITDAKVASDVTIASVTGAVGSVTAPVTAGTVSDKTGYALSGAGVQAIWDALTSALTTVGSVGKWIVDKLDAAVSTRGTGTALDAAGVRSAVGLASADLDTQLTTISGKTANLPSDPADQSLVEAAINTAVSGITAEIYDISSRLPAALTGAGNMKADMVAVSGDAPAADAFETMLDGSGGNKLSLSQLNIVASANDPAILASGSGSGAGIAATGGATAPGLAATGGATSGDGIKALGQGSGSNTAYGFNVVAGPNSDGAHYHGGATTGDGITFHAPTSGYGARFIGTGVGSDIDGSLSSEQINQIADQVWDEQIADHTSLGTVATSLANASAPTASEVADAVWDEAVGAHVGVGSTGEALTSAGSAGDPWSTTLPGAYGAGSAGKLLSDNLDAALSAVAALVSSIKAKTDALPATPADDTKLDTIDTVVDAIKAKTDALPAGVKANTAFGFSFYLEDTDGNPATGKTVAAKRLIDNGSRVTCTGAVTEKTAGWYYFNGQAADYNGTAAVGLEFSATGCKTVAFTLILEA